MATDARLSVAGRDFDAGAIMSQGQATGERFRTQGVREQILNQNAQIGQQSIEQNQRTQVLQGISHGANVLKGILSVPVVNRPALIAQNLELWANMGIPVEEFTSLDLTNDQAITDKINSFGLMSKAAEAKSVGVTDISLKDFTSESVGKFFDSGGTDFSLLERFKADQVVNVGGVPHLVNSLDGTASPIKLDDSGNPLLDNAGNPVIDDAPTKVIDAALIGATEAEIAEPTEQLKSDIKVSEAEQIEDIKAEVKAEDPVTIAALAATELKAENARLAAKAAREEINLGIDASYKTIDNITSILGSDRLDDIAGVKGKFPSGRPKTLDLINTVQQLSSLLTVGNLDVMSGVLSESDMIVIKGLANDIGIKFGKGDEANLVKGFSGSVEATVDKLRNLESEISSRLRRQGYGLEGDIANNPSTGERMQFINKEWVAL